MTDFLRKKQQEPTSKFPSGQRTLSAAPSIPQDTRRPAARDLEAYKGRFRLRVKLSPKTKDHPDGELEHISPAVKDEQAYDTDNSDRNISPTWISTTVDNETPPVPVVPPSPLTTTPSISLVSIKHPNSITRSLIDYYLHAYWTNSAAVNPDGHWTSITFADPAMIHTKLSLVALHRLDRHQTSGRSLDQSVATDLNEAHLYHRGRALTLIQNRLAQTDLQHQMDDNLIGATALLTSLDDHSATWSGETQDKHMLALVSMINSRPVGSLSEPLRRVLLWVDLLRAALSERPPLLRPEAMITGDIRWEEDELESLAVDVLGYERAVSLPQSRTGAEGPPVSRYFHSILDRLGTLLVVGKQLQHLPASSSAHARRLFGNAVYRLEYELLATLSNPSSPSQAATTSPATATTAMPTLPQQQPHPALHRAVRDAALICSYANLRLQNSRFIFTRLARRIRSNLMVLLLQHEDTDDMELLAWIVAMGWKAAVLARDDEIRGWFAGRIGGLEWSGLVEGNDFVVGGVDVVVEMMGSTGELVDRTGVLGLSADEAQQLRFESRRDSVS